MKVKPNQHNLHIKYKTLFDASLRLNRLESSHVFFRKNINRNNYKM